MININYDTPLKIILKSNNVLENRIRTFINEIPKTMKERIRHNIEMCEMTKGDNRWSYVDDGNTMNISVGSSKNYTIDYMSICIAKNNYESIFNSTLNGFGEVKLGFITLYLPKMNMHDKNESITFDFILRRKRNECTVYITTRFNKFLKSNIERLDNYEFKDVVVSLLEQSNYSINFDDFKKTRVNKL